MDLLNYLIAVGAAGLFGWSVRGLADSYARRKGGPR
jgi:hypothetical protein